MAVILLGTRQDIYMSQWKWVNTLSLARHFGWEPRGATPRRNLGFADDDYEFSAYQQVAEDDAADFADAIERATIEFANRGWDTAEAETVQTCDVAVPATFGLKCVHTWPAPQGDFAMCSRQMLAEWCEALKRLVSLCRDGGFVIS